MGNRDVVLFKVLRRESQNEVICEFTGQLTVGEDKHLLVPFGDDDFIQLLLRNDAETAKVNSCASAIMPYAIIKSTGKGYLLTVTSPVHLKHNYYVEVEIQHAALPKEKESGKRCGACAVFSHERGKELLLEDTHTFVEGEKGKMVQAIVDAMAETHKVATLTKDNVGYCPVIRGLCADCSPACDGYRTSK